MLDRRITANNVGMGVAVAIRPWLDEMPAAKLAEHLIGGIAVLDLPKSEMSTMLTEAFGDTDFITPPVPNTLFQRDPSCWIYKGVTCNPMFWPARQPETLLQRAVYKFHPRFKDADFTIWWGDSDEPFGAASVEGRVGIGPDGSSCARPRGALGTGADGSSWARPSGASWGM